MHLTNQSDRLDYLDLYDLQVTPTEARCLLLVITRINLKDLLVGEIEALNSLVKQLEEIANES